MLTITNTNQFIVKDFLEGYDNQYNEQLVALERHQAVQEAARLVLEATSRNVALVARRTGEGLLRGLGTYLESLQ